MRRHGGRVQSEPILEMIEPRKNRFDMCYIEPGDAGVLILKKMKENEKNVIPKHEILPLIHFHRHIIFALNPN